MLDIEIKMKAKDEGQACIALRQIATQVLNSSDTMPKDKRTADVEVSINVKRLPVKKKKG